MSEAEKRSVHTDALATLGTIIGIDAGRDAIHLAVEPVLAGERLSAGDEVGRLEDGTFGRGSTELLGIVDPFLKGSANKGDRFWLVLYPRQITSLRHVWEHPSFPSNESTAVEDIKANDPVSISRSWIEGFAGRIDQTYTRVMRAADEYHSYGEYTRDDTESYKDHWDEFPEFWKHYAVVTGKDVDQVKEDSFFTCSC